MSEGYNFAAVIVGPPQAGKTTAVRKIVREHLEKWPTGIALVHDPNRQFLDLCAPYDDVKAWRKAIAAAGAAGKSVPPGASIGGVASDITAAAIAMGREHNTAANIRVPILLAFDESSLMDTSGPTHLGDQDTQLLSNRRHWGIGPVYNVQRVTSLTEGFYTMATDVYVFTQPSATRTAKLEEYLGLAPGSLDELVGAPRYKYKQWTADRGLL